MRKRSRKLEGAPENCISKVRATPAQMDGMEALLLLFHLLYFIYVLQNWRQHSGPGTTLAPTRSEAVTSCLATWALPCHTLRSGPSGRAHGGCPLFPEHLRFASNEL